MSATNVVCAFLLGLWPARAINRRNILIRLVGLSGTGIKGSKSNSATTSTPLEICLENQCADIATQSATVHDKFDMLGTARARLGFLAMPNLLLYGTGGLAWTRFVQKTTDMVMTNVPGVLGQSIISTPDWRFGWLPALAAKLDYSTAIGCSALNICITTSAIRAASQKPVLYLRILSAPTNLSVSRAAALPSK